MQIVWNNKQKHRTSGVNI